MTEETKVLQWLPDTDISVWKKMHPHKLDDEFVRPSHLDTFAKEAIVIAERSTCLWYEVGAIIFDAERNIALSSGYNGAARGDVDPREAGCARVVDGALQEGKGLCRGSHAELNAIAHFDGTLARYQRRWSAFGSFYDKASDFITWTAIHLPIAGDEGQRTGSSLPHLLAAISTNAQAVVGYTKWLARAESEKLRWHQAKENPAEAIEKYTRAPVTACPPERSLSEWGRWFGRKMLNIFAFQDMDMFLWVGILIVLNEYMLSLWMLLGIHGAGVVAMVCARLWEMRTLDRDLKPFR